MSGEIADARPGRLPQREIPRHSLASLANAQGLRVKRVTRCGRCGKRVSRKAFAVYCRSCGTLLVQDSDFAERARPDGLRRFNVDEHWARAEFTLWMSSRRLAPKSLKDAGEPRTIEAVFLPYWSFSALAAGSYVGRRGESRQRQIPRNEDDKTRSKTEAYTEWQTTSGRVNSYLSDIVVPACSRLPEKHPSVSTGGIDPYVQGSIRSERIIAYDIEPEVGFKQAAALMRSQIDREVRRVIGGDRQEVVRVKPKISGERFTLLLLPAWLMSYGHHGRTWSVLVNGTNGRVVGARPYSAPKISLLIGAVAVAIALILTLTRI